MLRRDCCCLCHLQGHTWHSRRVAAVSACGVNVWGCEQSEQAVGVDADLHACSFPKASCSPQFVLLVLSKEFLVAGLHSWSVGTSLVSLGGHVVAGDFLPFGAAIKTAFTYCCLRFWLNQVRGNELKHLLNFTSSLSHSKQRTERQHHFH